MTKMTAERFEEQLEIRGYAVGSHDIDGCVDYINQTSETLGREYTVLEWLEETLQNYPDMVEEI